MLFIKCFGAWYLWVKLRHCEHKYISSYCRLSLHCYKAALVTSLMGLQINNWPSCFEGSLLRWSLQVALHGVLDYLHDSLLFIRAGCLDGSIGFRWYHVLLWTHCPGLAGSKQVLIALILLGWMGCFGLDGSQWMLMALKLAWLWARLLFQLCLLNLAWPAQATSTWLLYEHVVLLFSLNCGASWVTYCEVFLSALPCSSCYLMQQS